MKISYNQQLLAKTGLFQDQQNLAYRKQRRNPEYRNSHSSGRQTASGNGPARQLAYPWKEEGLRGAGLQELLASHQLTAPARGGLQIDRKCLKDPRLLLVILLHLASIGESMHVDQEPVPAGKDRRRASGGVTHVLVVGSNPAALTKTGRICKHPAFPMPLPARGWQCKAGASDDGARGTNVTAVALRPEGAVAPYGHRAESAVSTVPNKMNQLFLYVHDNITRAFEQAHLKLFEEVFRTIAPRWQFKGSVLRNVEGVTDLTGSELNACDLKQPYAALVARIRRQGLPCDNKSKHLLAIDQPITLSDCEGDGRTKYALGHALQEGCMGIYDIYGGVDTGKHKLGHQLGAVHETGDNYIMNPDGPEVARSLLEALLHLLSGDRSVSLSETLCEYFPSLYPYLCAKVFSPENVARMQQHIGYDEDEQVVAARPQLTAQPH